MLRRILPVASLVVSGVALKYAREANNRSILNMARIDTLEQALKRVADDTTAAGANLRAVSVELETLKAQLAGGEIVDSARLDALINNSNATADALEGMLSQGAANPVPVPVPPPVTPATDTELGTAAATDTAAETNGTAATDADAGTA
jgi:hypothetical protein